MFRMKITVVLGYLLLLSGCELHNKIFPPENCNKPISEYNKIIIALNTDNIMTVDMNLSGNSRESIKNIVTDSLEKTLNDKFRKEINQKQLTITKQTTCDAQSVVIEGDITYIKSYLTVGAFVPVKQRYEGELNARIKKCVTGDELSVETIDNSDDDFREMNKDLGRKLGRFAYDKLTTCQTPKSR